MVRSVRSTQQMTERIVHAFTQCASTSFDSPVGPTCTTDIAAASTAHGATRKTVFPDK
jgi:hypothetical protein